MTTHKDMIFELFRHHLISDDKELAKREKDYKAGKITDSENKKYATEPVGDPVEACVTVYNKYRNQ